jgi:hypothetical protein
MTLLASFQSNHDLCEAMGMFYQKLPSTDEELLEQITLQQTCKAIAGLPLGAGEKNRGLAELLGEIYLTKATLLGGQETPEESLQHKVQLAVTGVTAPNNWMRQHYLPALENYTNQFEPQAVKRKRFFDF